MDDNGRERPFLSRDEPLPADLEDLEGDGPQDAEEVTARVVAPDPPEVEAAIEAAREDAGRYGLDRRYAPPDRE